MKNIQSNAFVEFHDLLNDNILPKEKSEKGKDFKSARHRKKYLTELETWSQFFVSKRS